MSEVHCFFREAFGVMIDRSAATLNSSKQREAPLDPTF
jgi:hypothetical protein